MVSIKMKTIFVFLVFTLVNTAHQLRPVPYVLKEITESLLKKQTVFVKILSLMMENYALLVPLDVHYALTKLTSV